MAVFALVILVVLLVGGPVLVGFGVYLGVLAYRARAVAVPGPPTELVPTPNNQSYEHEEHLSQKVFGLRPSYGLSAACMLLGALMFVSGVALVGNADKPSQMASTTGAARPALPSSRATWSSPPPSSSMASASAPTALSTVVRPLQPTEVVTPVETPEARPPVKPPPVAPAPPAPSGKDDEPVVYYKNCGAARAAGAAPIRRGEPGYRAGLDRDNDGIACEK